MELSKSRFNFSAAAVKSGSRVTGSIYPTLYTSSTKDKFILDTKAMRLLELKPGDRVQLIDLIGQVEEGEPRFGVCKGGVDEKGRPIGAVLGKDHSFSYSGIWAAMLMFSAGEDVMEASMTDLLDAGLVVKRGNNYIATVKGSFRLELATATEEVDEEEVEVTVFDVMGIKTKILMAVSQTWEEHTPKTMNVNKR